MHSRIRLLLFPVLAVLPLTMLRAEVVAISSVTFNDYTRATGNDGGVAPEYFVLGEGGRITRPTNDPGLEKLTFGKVAYTIAGPLAKANYLPATNAADAKLLILVFWGATAGSGEQDPGMFKDRAAAAIANNSRNPPPGGSSQRVNSNSAIGAEYESALWMMSVANQERDQLDEHNARIMGYDEALDRARFLQATTMGKDTIHDVSSNRYYVVLQAYDYEFAKAHKKMRPLWTTRMSVSEDGDFAEALARMSTSSIGFFGQNSDGLRRARSTGTVRLGPMDVLEVTDDKSARKN